MHKRKRREWINFLTLMWGLLTLLGLLYLAYWFDNQHS